MLMTVDNTPTGTNGLRNGNRVVGFVQPFKLTEKVVYSSVSQSDGTVSKEEPLK